MSLSKLLQIGQYFEQVVASASELCRYPTVAASLEANANLQWEQFGGPPPGEQDMHQRIFALCRPGVKPHLKPRRWRNVRWALQILNGRWKGIRIWHHCTVDPETGRPCCNSPGAAQDKVKRALTILLFACEPDLPCTTRWLTVRAIQDSRSKIQDPGCWVQDSRSKIDDPRPWILDP